MTLAEMLERLATYEVPGATMWGDLVRTQRARILEAHGRGALTTELFQTAYGTASHDGGGATNADYLAEYAAWTGLSEDAVCRAICPVPTMGNGPLRPVVYEGNPISHRHIWAHHYARRVLELCRTYGDGVCEVGGGVGFTLFYCWRLGARPIVSIDLWPSLIHQTLLLSQYGCVRVNTPVVYGAFNLFDALTDYADLLGRTRLSVWLNTDSLAEMDPAVARGYPAIAQRHGARVFYSVNRVYGGISAGEVFAAAGWSCVDSRPFARTELGGYREEVFRAP